MRNSILTAVVLLSTVFSLHARKIELDEHVTSVDGCEWHITGWVDVSLTIGWPPIEINQYDVTMSGPCGEYHFQSGINSSGGNGITYYNPTLYDLDLEEEVTLESFSQLSEVIQYLENKYDE